MTKSTRSGVVAIGVSTGGPDALAVILPRLPNNLDVPILVVQHLPATFSATLVETLSGKCELRVKEAEHGECCEANVVYLSPGGYHMEVENRQGRLHLCLTDGPPENYCKPSVDVLFRSLARRYPGKVCAVILTGMGKDGTEGLKHLRRAGAFVIAQDAASCVVYGMSREAIEAGVVDSVVPLERVAETILRSVRGL